jgi:aminoglycoside/choline kinase family phosphotransferase
MVCEGRNPGVLDFQDAVAGPITYDLVSLVKDCYLCWPAPMRERWVSQYHAAAAERGLPVGSPERFAEALAWMGVQRHLKAAGIFARLWHRDGKRRYLEDIPQTLAYVVEAARDAEALQGLAAFLEERVLPALGSCRP